MSGQDVANMSLAFADVLCEMVEKKDPTGLWLRRWFMTRKRRLDRWSNVRRMKRARQLSLRGRDRT